jgi:hypothetical protein
MASADLELQGAMLAALKADATVASLVAGRIYDQTPDPVTFPYVTIGEAQFVRDDATCLSGGEVFLTLHAWSRAVGFPEVKRIADAVVEALHLAALSLPTNRLISINHRQNRVFRDDDGLTSHAVIELVAYVEKPLA